MSAAQEQVAWGPYLLPSSHSKSGDMLKSAAGGCLCRRWSLPSHQRRIA